MGASVNPLALLGRLLDAIAVRAFKPRATASSTSGGARPTTPDNTDGGTPSSTGDTSSASGPADRPPRIPPDFTPPNGPGGRLRDPFNTDAPDNTDGGLLPEAGEANIATTWHRQTRTAPSESEQLARIAAQTAAAKVAGVVNATPLGVGARVVGAPGVLALELAGINDPKAAAALTNPIGTVVSGVAGAIADALTLTHERPLTPEQRAAYDAAVLDPTKAGAFARAMGTRGTKQAFVGGEYVEMGGNAREDDFYSDPEVIS